MFYIITNISKKQYKTLEEAKKAFKKMSYKKQLDSYITDEAGAIVSEN